jgi:adenylate kinase family enzyme|tara:strand:+ start:370 stop:1020 length:651 start_codon:yes stop_codon:yes gene_type:complete
MKKILIMGLSGAGKTYLAERLVPKINAVWLNADKVRKEANDWDFSDDGRKRQAKRMRDLAQKAISEGKYVVADFICPTEKTRNEFAADYVVWVDTIKSGRYEDTNKIFEPPKKFNFRVQTKNADLWSLLIADKLIPYKWDNKKPTAQMLGRWQPWHKGHQTLFEEKIKKTGQVNIQVRDVKGREDNTFDFDTVKKNIQAALKEYGERVKISLVNSL